MNVPWLIRRFFRRPAQGTRRFAVVEKGVLYRSGQPSESELAAMHRQHGIRTVVCLRGTKRRPGRNDELIAEEAFCRENGLEFVTIPCNVKTPPDDEQIKRFLDLVNDVARRPVLVHCRQGRQRTMLFVAIFRIVKQGWSIEAAVKEMDGAGFASWRPRHQALLKTLRRSPLIQRHVVESRVRRSA